MHVHNQGPEDAVLIQLESGDSHELRMIAKELLPEWLRLFAQKNKDYGNNAAVLGERGQFADIWRKMAKLKKSMWDGEELLFEDSEEVIKDLIGHLFLSLNLMRIREEGNRVYAYNEDDAAVDAIFRMVGGDASRAYQLSYALTPPFGDLVRARAGKAMEDDAREEMARRCSDPSLSLEAATERLREAGMTNGSDEPILLDRSRLLDLKPGQRITAKVVGGKAGQKYRLESPYANLASDEFAESDQEQSAPPFKFQLKINGKNAVATERPLRDDDPVHTDPEDELDEAIREEDHQLLTSLGEMVDGVTDEVLKGEAKAILDKLFKNSDKQRELLSRFERKVRGY